MVTGDFPVAILSNDHPCQAEGDGGRVLAHHERSGAGDVDDVGADRRGYEIGELDCR